MQSWIKISSLQDSELPSRRDVLIVVADGIPVVTDTEDAIRTDVADVDTVAVQIHRRCTGIFSFDPPLTSGQKVANNRVDHHLSCGHFVLAEECLLLLPVLRSRVVHWSLTNELPVDFAMLLGKELFIIPGGLVVVEKLALDGLASHPHICST